MAVDYSYSFFATLFSIIYFSIYSFFIVGSIGFYMYFLSFSTFYTYYFGIVDFPLSYL